MVAPICIVNGLICLGSILIIYVDKIHMWTERMLGKDSGFSLITKKIVDVMVYYAMVVGICTVNWLICLGLIAE